MREFTGAKAEDALQATTDLFRLGLQALPAHIAVVDSVGAVLLVNRAWMTFAALNCETPDCKLAVGANYLEVSRRASAGDEYAHRALAGISAVLEGSIERFSMEYPCHSPSQQRWFVMDAAALDVLGGGGAIISHLDITARKLAELALGASETRFRAMFDKAAVGMAEIAADGRWLRANPALLRIAGRSEGDLRSKTVQDVTFADDIDADAAHFEVLRSGGADSCMMEKRLRRPDGALVWTEVTLSCVRAESGGVDYFIAVVEDISERKLAEERQLTMMRELAHRGKNLLAVIQSVAHRSLTDDRPLAESRDAFNGRLSALASTYGVLTDEAFDGANLETILHNNLAAFGARAGLQGPSVILTVKAAQTFGLIAHELSTNAAKYGALSVAAGLLRVSWRIEKAPDGDKFVFDWSEQGGPSCKPPSRRGFGTVILTRIAGAEFECQPRLVYGEDGFHYRIEAPLERVGVEMTVSPLRRNLKNDLVCSLYDQWARLRGPNGGLPQLANFDWSRFAATGALTFATIDAADAVRFIEIGRALIGELGHPITEEDLASGEAASLADIYRRCARKAEPCHEFLRFDFGDGDPLTFERLLVPFCATRGREASHVVGIAIYDGQTRLPEKA